MKTTLCNYCGCETPINDKMECSKCGSPVKKSTMQSESKNRFFQNDSLIPEGIYVISIDSTQIIESKRNKKDKMMKIKYNIEEGSFRNKKLYDVIPHVNTNKEIENYGKEKLKLIEKSFSGRSTTEVVIKNEQHELRRFNVIKGYMHK